MLLVNDNYQVMGDEKETSLLVGLISDERDTSFIIKLSLTVRTGDSSLPLLEMCSIRPLMFRVWTMQSCLNYKRRGRVRKLEKIWVMCFVCVKSECSQLKSFLFRFYGWCRLIIKEELVFSHTNETHHSSIKENLRRQTGTCTQFFCGGLTCRFARVSFSIN